MNNMKFFSIVIMGGDGTFGQCVNGLIQQQVKNNGGDLDNKDLKIERNTEVTVGFLPGGDTYTKQMFFFCTYSVKLVV